MSNELTSSSRFKLCNEYEVVWLETAGNQIVVGDHYGDPSCGLIDESNGWCASFGEGVIIFWLQAPFQPYLRGQATEQWSEWGRENDLRFVIGVRQLGPFDLEVATDEGGVQFRHVLRFSGSQAGIVEVQPGVQADRP